MNLPARVEVVEVGPRDGLQNEATVPVETRITLIERLADTGLKQIEAGSFVSASAVPSMARTAEVLAGVQPRPGLRLSVLVPNLRGLDDAVAAGAAEIAVFASASETFSQENIGCSIAESLDRYARVVEEASRHGVAARGYVSCILGCPYEGDVAPESVVAVSTALHDMGCREISLGDTIGVGTPLRARSLVERAARHVPLPRLAVHFHDTYGQALANIFACLEAGVTVIDSAVAGLGGCPYAPGATGNVATEDVIYMLNGLGVATGVELDPLLSAGLYVSHVLGREPASRVARAFAARRRGGAVAAQPFRDR